MGGYIGGARNVLLYQAELLSSEERNTDALYHYIAVLYYDMNNYGNASAEDVWIAPAIVKAIYDKKEYYTAEMVDRCFDRYPLPQYKMSKAKFSKLLNLIFEDET